MCLCVICMPSQMMPDVFYLSDSPASWWRFAFNVVLSRVTEHTRRQTWAFVVSRAQLNMRYVRAYTRKLTDPVLDADMSVSCHLCVSAASLCVPMCGASLCVPMCGASLCVLMCGEHLLACLFCFVCFHLSYLMWEGGSCSFTPMWEGSGCSFTPMWEGGGCSFTPMWEGSGCSFTPMWEGGGCSFTPIWEGGDCSFTPMWEGGGCSFTPMWEEVVVVSPPC